MKMETISFIRSNVANLDVSEPIAVTQNGKPVYVIESYAEWAQRNKELEQIKAAIVNSR